MLSKLDLAVIVIGLAAVLIGTEQAHRIVIDTPAGAGTGGGAAALAVVNPCPDSDNIADSASCLVFQSGDQDRSPRWWTNASDRTVAASVEAPAQFATLSPNAACPDRDNVPYSAGCVKFLSGWLWRANAAEAPVVARTYAP